MSKLLEYEDEESLAGIIESCNKSIRGWMETTSRHISVKYYTIEAFSKGGEEA